MNANMEPTCDRFDQAEAKLKSFTRSAVRTKVMLCLLSGEKDAGELEDTMDLRSSTILHSIKEMIEVGLVVKAARGYALTNIGRIQALLLEDLISTIVALDQHKEFWLTHDVSGIPLDMQTKIGMLAQSEVLEASPVALLKVVDNAIAEMVKAKEILGLSPIIVPGFANAIAASIENGAKVDLILTDSVIKEVQKDYQDVISELMHSENFRLYRIDMEVKVAFTVADLMLSLGLYRLDGKYDFGNDLICIGEKASRWGRALFEYYRSRSYLISDI